MLPFLHRLIPIPLAFVLLLSSYGAFAQTITVTWISPSPTTLLQIGTNDGKALSIDLLCKGLYVSSSMTARTLEQTFFSN